jgi:large subunit ribosomal protein L10
VKAGYLEGAVLSAGQIGAIASLPSREVLLARFVGGMYGPVGGYVRCLGGMLRQFVAIMDTVSRKGSSH